MKTIRDVFDAFGGPTAFAKAIGLEVSAASEMKRRESIPVKYWGDLVEAAGRQAISGLTYEVLVGMHSSPRAKTGDARRVSP